MNNIVNIIVIHFVGSLLSILQFMFFARAIMSWFVQGGSSKIYEFLCFVTEPIIQPFRSLLSCVSALRNSPFDFAFMLAFFVLIILEQLVYML
ncbi:YggT family protein [uncultured Agathobaculum sp.]|uniref:YggT family protein n=1 Tax=uncultured Agathobaculum sp. TaxID=2048140 RepID=UPI00296FBB38